MPIISDGLGLLRAVAAHPTEYDRRLVYADFLLDQSTSPDDWYALRAEFVRVQCWLEGETGNCDACNIPPDRLWDVYLHCQHWGCAKWMKIRENTLFHSVLDGVLEREMPFAFPHLFRQERRVTGSAIRGCTLERVGNVDDRGIIVDYRLTFRRGFVERLDVRSDLLTVKGTRPLWKHLTQTQPVAAIGLDGKEPFRRHSMDTYGWVGRSTSHGDDFAMPHLIHERLTGWSSKKGCWRWYSTRQEAIEAMERAVLAWVRQ